MTQKDYDYSTYSMVCTIHICKNEKKNYYGIINAEILTYEKAM